MVAVDVRRTFTQPTTPVKAEQVGTLLDKVCGPVRVYDISVLSRFLSGTSPASSPKTLTLLSDPQDDHQSQLFVDYQPIARANWHLTSDGKKLTWRQGSLFGSIEMPVSREYGFGLACVGGANFSVKITLKPVPYICDVAANAGTYVTGDASQVTLHWDTTSSAWQNATWEKGLLQFAYGLEDQIFIGQHTRKIVTQFTDQRPDSKAQWNPADGSFDLYLSSELDFIFTLDNTLSPPSDTSGSGPIGSVFPYVMAFKFDEAAATFAGAMLTGEETVLGTSYAVQGQVVNPSVVGFYALQENNSRTPEAVIAVHQGRLVINQEAITTSQQIGNRLTWNDLPSEVAKQAGLPASGYLRFNTSGTEVVESGHGVVGRRLSAGEVATLPESRPGKPPILGQAVTASDQRQVSLGDALDDLTNMTQFEQNAKGNWVDVVQQNAMNDFYDILQYYLPSDLQAFFPARPTLSSAVQGIAAEKGLKGSDPATWYGSLAIPYLTKALSQSSDPAAKKLNAVRAQAMLKEQLAQNDVYHAQAPNLYLNQWLIKYPTFADNYLVDQQQNQASYAPDIQQDSVAWKQQVQDSVTPDPSNPHQLDTVLKDIDTLAAAGEGGLAWAYIFFRWITQPATLNLLQMLAYTGQLTDDGSGYARRVQQNVAVLNMLDSSGLFSKTYMQYLQCFQIGNILPTLLDYSGDPDAYNFGVQQILQAFVQQYINSTDPNIQQAVQEIQAVLANDQMREILEAFQGIAEQFSGVYSWTQLATKFEDSLPTILKNVSAAGAKLVTLAAVGFGAMSFIYGVKDWSNLTPDEKASLITSAVGMFAQLVGALVQRLVPFGSVLSTDGLSLDAFKVFISQDALREAESNMSNGLAKWLSGKGTAAPVSEGAGSYLLESEAVNEDADVVTRLLGRNLDEFLAVRLGTVLALASVIFSSIDLAKAVKEGDQTAEIGDGLVLAGSVLQLMATAGGWAVEIAGVEAVEIGVLAISTILSVVGAIAGIAAIAGVIVLLILGFLEHPESPIQQFAEKQAESVGLYMPQETDIDYFQVYQLQGQPQRLGAALCLAGTTLYLTFNNTGQLTLGPQTGNYDTAFFLSTDAAGHAQFGTLLNDSSGQQLAYILTVDDNQQLACQPLLTGDKADQQRWIATLITGDSVVFEENHVKQADFLFYNAYYASQKVPQILYLQPDLTDPTQSKVTVGTTAQGWTLSMVVMQPAQLGMDNITLYTYQRDQPFTPSLGQHGSAPLTWAIDPALPSFMTFDTKTGTIAQATGVQPPVTPIATYTLTVSNAVGSAKTTFTFEVKERQFTTPLA